MTNFIMIVFTTIGAVGSLAWWLSAQFNNQRDMFFAKLGVMQALILDKIEYHERHDDRRFSEVREDVLDIRLRNAAIDGPTNAQRGHIRRVAEELAKDISMAEGKKEDK